MAPCAGLRRRYAALAEALLAAWRVDFASRLGRLRDRRKAGATTTGAFDLGRRFAGFQALHDDHFPDTTSTQAMSLCITNCWARLSHFRVTPAQSFSVTVAWSFLSSRQYTRAPTFNDLDWDPVIHFAVSVAVLLVGITLVPQPGDSHDGP